MSRVEVWYRREGEWVGAVTRIVHAARLEHSDYHYYAVTACGMRADAGGNEHAFHSLPDNNEVTCLRCWAHINDTRDARLTPGPVLR